MTLGVIVTVKIDEVTDREIVSDLITDTETQCLEWHTGYTAT